MRGSGGGIRILRWSIVSAVVLAGTPRLAVGQSQKGGPSGRTDAAPARRGTTGATLKLDSPLDRRKVEFTKQADAKRNEEIKILKQLIPRAGRDRKAEMIFRLADLYWQKSRYRYGIEFERYETDYARWVEDGQKGTPPNNSAYIRRSTLIKRNALRLYERVLKAYPTYPRNDEVLFNLANNEYESGRKKTAVKRLKRLIREFPKSRLVADSHLLLGEYYFNDNRVIDARRAYQKATKTDEGRIKYYATYKLAWCDYNIQEYAAGILKLKRVIAHAETAPDTNAVRLGSEALNDLARFFSYVGAVGSAFQYFEAKGGSEKALAHTSALARLYHEQGKWQKEIDTYRVLLNAYPLADRAPSLQANIVEAYAQLGQSKAVRAEVARLVDRYGPGSKWREHHVDKGEEGRAALEVAYELTETKLRNLVTEFHRDAQKRRNVPTYRLARDIYAKYLEAFPSSDSAYQMRYYYAEVLWALLQWRDAAEQYRLVAVAPSPDGRARGKYTREAAYNQILAYEKVLKTGRDRGSLRRVRRLNEKRKGRTSAGAQAKRRVADLDKRKSHDERPIPENQMRLAMACDLYFKLAAPDDDELPAIKFRAAYIFYQHNHFVEAAKRYFDIIDKWPGSRLSKKSANLILDSLNVQQKWDELAFYAAKFRDNRRLTGRDKAFKKEVQELLEGATYLSIQSAEKEARKNQDKAQKEAQLATVASRFRRFQGEHPRSKYASKATYSAVVIFDQADELDNAIEMAELLKKKYPKSELSRDNDWSLAQFYEGIADFGHAAELYDEYVERYPKDRRAVDALYNAGTYYQGLGRAGTAVARYRKYIDEYPKRKDVADVYWRICRLRVGQKDYRRAADCFDGFRRRFPRASATRVFESRYRYALALKALKKKKDFESELKKLVRAYRGLSKADRGSSMVALGAAHAEFALLESDFVRYMKMRITLNPRTLRRKLAKAEELACDNKCKKSGRYVSVLDYGNGEFGICALTRIGQVYRNVATAIREAPVPKLTPEQEEIYRAELDDRALTPEEKGREAFEAALAKAYELSVYNDCTRTAQKNLKQMRPDRFPDLQKRAYLDAEGFITAGLRGSQRPASPVAASGAEPSSGAGGRP